MTVRSAFSLLVFASLAFSCGASPGSDGGTSPGSNDGGGPITTRVDGGDPELLPDGGPPASTADFASGSRLKARWIGPEGVGSAFAGFFDTERNEECTVMPSLEGKSRCLPSHHASAAFELYSDAACSKPVAITDKKACGPAPSYAVEGNVLVCPEERKVMKVGARQSLGTVYLRETDGSCTVQTGMAGMFDFYPVGEEVAPDAFVQMTAQTSTTGKRLERVVWTGVDGSRSLKALYDTTRSEECAFGNGADGELRCLPVTLRLSPWEFGNDICTEPRKVVMVNPGVCFEEKYAARPDVSAQCPRQGPSLYPIGGATTPGAYYNNYSGACFPSSPFLEADYYALGDEVPAADFARGVASSVGSGALMTRRVTSDDGVQIESGWTHSNGQDCAPMPAADGKLRCLPVDAITVGNYYSDSSCTQAVSVAMSSEPCAAATRAIAREAACPNKARVFAVGSQIQNPRLYTLTPQGCSSTFIDAADRYFEVATEVPASTFPEVEQSTD